MGYCYKGWIIMLKTIKFINKLSEFKKVACLILLSGLFLLFYIAISTVVNNQSGITISTPAAFKMQGGGTDDTGYRQTGFKVGRNSSSYLGVDPYITNKSAITLEFSYFNSSSDHLVDHTHNLMSTILLPLGTVITLLDHINHKVYTYKITTASDIYNYNNSCAGGEPGCIKVATYPFVSFKEIGRGASNNFYPESAYYNNGTVNEKFTIVLDFASTNISTNFINVSLYLELHDSGDIAVRQTIDTTIEEFNIYSNVSSVDSKATLYLTTSYTGSGITFNSDSSTNINITSGITYKYVNGFRITDTTYENKEIGISVKLVDSNGTIVDRENLKNVIFQVGTSKYYPGNDNVVRINLQGGISDVSKSLTIITSENNGNLTAGTYYFKISNYASYDGHYYEELGNTELSIPVNVSGNNFNSIYSFDVIMYDSSRIISKTDSEVRVILDILQNGPLNDPNIRISLYKKDQLTAYNQDYSIVDLSYYVSDELDLFAENVYYVTTDPIQYGQPQYFYNYFEMNLITANFENNGYKFVVDLYDGTNKIGSINKYFIVKEEEV